MLFSVNDLTGYTAKADDFTASVIDVFAARDTLRVSHLAIDIGGWLSNQTVVISVDKLSDIDPSSRSLKLNIGKKEAENAALLNTTGVGEGLQFAAVPELILGPSRDDVSAEFLSRNAPEGRFLSISGVAGSVANNGKEDIGRVIALIADSDELKVSHLAVDTGVELSETQRVIPVSFVETLGDADTKTILTIDADTLNDSPQLENFDVMDRHWFDKVASYYGLK